MELIRVAAIALNTTPLDWEGNYHSILASMESARQQGASILCLPELCITGYGCEDAFLSRGIQTKAIEILHKVASYTEGLVVSVGLPFFYQNILLNTACLLVDGKIAGIVPKQNLAGDGIHYEPRWFKPWPTGKCTIVKINRQEIPLGDFLFDVGGVRIGFEICEDAWVAQRPGAALALRGVDILLNPSASHFALGKHAMRERLVNEGSRAFGVSYIYANLLGNESGRVLYDGGTLIAENGSVVGRGKRFSFADFEMALAIIDIDATRTVQSRTASFQPQLGEDASCVEVNFDFPPILPLESGANAGLPIAEDQFASKEEEFTRAMTLGLWDYLRKSRSEGLVISLSGGCDSTVVAVLSAQMIELSWNQLGPEKWKNRLPYMPGLSEVDTPRQAIHRLITCVYQSTRNSTPVTRNAAWQVAKALGVDFLELNVDALVSEYTKIVENALSRTLDWKRDDVSLQNIQARARGPSVWMIANIKNALLLATSNRSEAAVGYATMDGDTCGGLSPIAGIDKAFLRRYLKWAQKQGPNGLQPIPVLQLVTDQQPTAELRPPERQQTDEADLMPYEVLDIIERLAIRDKLTPKETYERLRAIFTQTDSRSVAGWVERFFRLWCRNQWKRERYAPSFHLDEESLDPKSWCRFPILSSGYQSELTELQEIAKRS